MTPTQWLALGAFACASFAANAQPAPARPNPIDANAAVPSVSYRSAFDTYQRAPSQEQAAPDKVWRLANDDVTKSDAHSGHAMPGVAAAPATPAAPKAPPADHSNHH